MAKKKPYFLKYQQDYLNDPSRLKTVLKSRRIGFTYVQAYEDVRDAAKTKTAGGMDVWFSSADLSAAREYILYCKDWARLLNIAAKDLDEVVLDEEKDLKAFVIEFASGFRINALSSNPKAFRSKGGKVVLDEFAFHSDAKELMRAASPSITWGYPLRILSTENGINTLFHKKVEEAKAPNSKTSLHVVTLMDAIEDGLVGRIYDMPDDQATEEQIEEFIATCRETAGDEDTFQQEYMCNALDGKNSYIPYGLIYANEDESLKPPVLVFGEQAKKSYQGNLLATHVNEIRPEDYLPALSPALQIETSANSWYLGVDIGRKNDLSVFWLDELIGDVFWTRLVLELHQVKFRHQYAWLKYLLTLKHTEADKERNLVARSCLDSTGIGMQLAEDAQDEFGSYRVEAVHFTAQIKEDMAILLKRKFEDKALRNPAIESVRKDFNKIKREVTQAGNIRFYGERDEAGHSDRFWAKALANLAANQQTYIPYISRKTQSTRVVSDQSYGYGRRF